MTAAPPPAPEIDFARPADEVAQALIGALLLVDGVGGPIVETEAYDQGDAASHAFRGRDLRNASLFGPPGHAYIYRSYGLHWCLNFVCEAEGHGAGVLIRALEPTHGVAAMRERRGEVMPLPLLCAGPGRLCEALGVTGALDGRPLHRPPFVLQPADRRPAVVRGPRIGITKAVDLPWRFGLQGSRFVSRRFR